MQKKKKNHYLPQFYLSRFADIQQSRKGGKPVIWVYEKDKSARMASPRNEAHENYFYSYEDESGATHSIEDHLARIESVIAPMVRRLDESGYLPSVEERAELAGFVALTFMRGPAARGFLDALASRLMRKTAEDRAKDEVQFAKDYDAVFGTKPTSVSKEELRSSILSGEYELRQGSRGFNLKMMMEATIWITQALREYDWQILESDPGDIFLTTDVPVITVLPDGAGRATFGVGFGMPGVEVLFPVGTNICLKLAAHQGNGRFRVPGAMVRQINKLEMACARRFVYASERSTALEKLFSKMGCKVVYGENALLPNPAAPGFTG